MKLYNSFDQLPSKRSERQVSTNLAGKFRHPDWQFKSIVESGKVINRSLRISSVTVRSQGIKLAKKKLIVETMPKYETIRTEQPLHASKKDVNQGIENATAGPSVEYPCDLSG